MSRTFRHIPWEERYIAAWRKCWYSKTGDEHLIIWDDKDRRRNGYDGGMHSALEGRDRWKEHVNGRKARRWLKRFHNRATRRAGKQEIKNQCDQ